MNSIIQMDSEINQAYAGFGFFDIYHRDSFKQPARTTWIDGWKIEYMAIADPKTIHKTPIVIVGGAFQNFNSYKYCVEQLFESGPVILIDLPSMGANQQITNREEESDDHPAEHNGRNTIHRLGTDQHDTGEHDSKY